jgi:signal transduction histidine kinase
MEDTASSYWLYTECGLLRIARTEIDAWIRDPRRKVGSTMFDSADGIVLVGLLNYARPVVTKSPDGSIWFVNGSKLAVIDPRMVSLNTLPPPVHVEEIAADGKSYLPTQGLHLPPLIRNMAIRYTALSLALPEKVRFRYKLEGQDPDWREVVNERKVQYSNLAPGTYRFRVTASNSSGLWNPQAASLEFSIAPAFWQTLWFRAACGAAVVGLLWTFYLLRLRQVARQFERTLDARVAERTRIARDLHDTLLQSFPGFLPHPAASTRLFRSQPDQALRMLEETLDQAKRAVKEGREAVQGLRSSTEESNNMATSIGRLAGELSLTVSQPQTTAGTESRAIDTQVHVEGEPRNLHPIVRDEVYRIAGEVLRNAFQHSQATQIEVELHYTVRQFRLRIRDNGQGIDPQILLAGGREGHFGLRGMRERAELAGGKLTVWSAPGSGTEVEVTIPASRAYGHARLIGVRDSE